MLLNQLHGEDNWKVQAVISLCHCSELFMLLSISFLKSQSIRNILKPTSMYYRFRLPSPNLLNYFNRLGQTFREKAENNNK
jgi:hypothetical protein